MLKKILLGVLVLSMAAMPVLAANEWRNAAGVTPPGTTAINDIDTVIDSYIVQPAERILGYERRGMKLTYSSASQLTVSAGSVGCNDGATTFKLRVNTSSTTVTWSDIDTGAEASNTSYYVYSSCDADATTATFKISTSSSAPSGVTSYRRLGSFTNNSSGDIEQVANDDETVIVATGTVSNGGTISLPSGWAQDECKWTVGLGSGSVSGSHSDGIYYTATVNSSRVATCTYTDINGGGSSGTTTCNYIIVCHR